MSKRACDTYVPYHLQAGGVASTGMFQGSVQRILDVVPEHIHDRCPIIMGCERDCSKVLALYD